MNLARCRKLSNYGTKTHLVFLILVSIFALSSQAFATGGVSCKQVDGATQHASQIRGLKVIKTVPCRVQDKPEVEQYLLDAIKEKIPKDRLEYEGEIYRILGIIPKEYKYLEGMVDLYTSQLGGYYDPDKEYYAMASWMPAALQYPIAVHEMVHALQDQHFTLDKLMDHFSHDSDQIVARSALAEGDATAVMMDFTRKIGGQGPIVEEKSVAAIMMQNIAGAMVSSSMQEAPSALQAMLIFPYVSGLRFAHALLKDGGYPRIDKAFKMLPESTEHILHPEIYLKGERGFIDVPIPSPPKSVPVSSTKPVHSDRLGEFFVSTFLGMQIPARKASSAASGWGGDKIALYKLDASSRYLLVWVHHWDSVADAKEFFEALTAYYEKRLEKSSSGNAETRTFLDPDFGPVEIFIDNQHTRLTVGR